jgi:hypothetical protein
MRGFLGKRKRPPIAVAASRISRPRPSGQAADRDVTPVAERKQSDRRAIPPPTAATGRHARRVMKSDVRAATYSVLDQIQSFNSSTNNVTYEMVGTNTVANIQSDPSTGLNYTWDSRNQLTTLSNSSSNLSNVIDS